MQTYTFKPNDDGLSMAVMSYESCLMKAMKLML